MGIVTKQATQNTANIIVGTVLGAVNTLLVLPLAFKDFPEGWGLLKVITAYGLILAQFFSLGAPNVMVRYMPQTDETEHRKLNFLTLLLTTAGALVLCLGFFLFRDGLAALFNPESRALLSPEMGKLLLLAVTLGYFYLFGGYLTATLNSVFYTFLNESFLKIIYLLLALAYLAGWFSFEAFLVLYVLTYVVVLILVLCKAISKGYRISFAIPVNNGKVIEYGLFSIMDKGAAVVVNSLDIVMIGLILNLEDVAFYTLAFYIGSVVMIPQKALVAITGPLISRAIKEGDMAGLADLYSKSAVNQLLAGGFIFVCVWINIDPVMSLMPDKFSGGKWVVFFIGVSKIFYLLSANNAAILVYSRYYRTNFYFSLMLVAVTIATNAVMIPKWGIEGAAAATAISFFFFTLNRTWFVKRKFGLIQFSKPLVFLAVFLLGAGVAGHYFQPGWPPMVEIGTKCAVIALFMLFYLRKMRPSEELDKMIKRKIPKW